MAKNSTNTAVNYLKECVDYTARKVRITSLGGSVPSLTITTGSGSVSIASTSTLITGTNLSRATATFVNDSDEAIYLGLGTIAYMNAGIRLNAFGGSYEINGMNQYSGSVYAICSSGTKNLCYTEITSA